MKVRILIHSHLQQASKIGLVIRRVGTLILALIFSSTQELTEVQVICHANAMGHLSQTFISHTVEMSMERGPPPLLPFTICGRAEPSTIPYQQVCPGGKAPSFVCLSGCTMT